MDNLVDWKDKLKSKCSIVTVISKYMPLQKKGKTYWGCCPFHHEKTPSFAVNEIGQYYHCFGCGVGGDVIKFVQSIEGLDFMDTVKSLAKDVNFELPQENFEDENIAKQKKQRDRLFEICTETAKFYYKNLNLPIGEKARKYLEKRKVDKSTIVKMGLGFSPDFSSLFKHLSKLGYSKEEMILSGVITEKAETGNVYDSMAKRLVFPIFNANSKVCGFSGRAMEDGALAKYKNTGATPIFNKSNIMYGLNLLRKARVEDRNFALLVEGQMDVIACHQAGITNAIATLGTAFNENHVSVLQRFVDTVIICFDGDNAGKKAAVRSLEPLMKGNFEIKVVSINDAECKDPDEFIKKRGAEAFEKLIDEAKNVWEFEITELASHYNLKDKLSLSKYINSAMEIIARIQGFAEREIYLKMLSSISGINYEMLERQYLDNEKRKLKNNNETVQEKQPTFEDKEKEKLYNAQMFALASVLHKKDYAKSINSNLFEDQNLKDFYNFLEKNNFPIVSRIYDYYKVDEIDWLKKLVYFNFSQISKEEETFKGCLKTIKLSKLYEKQQQLSEKLKQVGQAEKIEILKQIQEISKQIQNGKTEE